MDHSRKPSAQKSTLGNMRPGSGKISSAALFFRRKSETVKQTKEACFCDRGWGPFSPRTLAKGETEQGAAAATV